MHPSACRASPRWTLVLALVLAQGFVHGDVQGDPDPAGDTGSEPALNGSERTPYRSSDADSLPPPLDLDSLPSTVHVETTPLPAHTSADANPPFTSIRQVTPSGVWTWFSDPRAVTLGNKTYVGWVTSSGDVEIGSIDHVSGVLTTATLFPRFQQDDHVNPAILVLPDRRLMVFFARHALPGLFSRVSRNPEDITSWEFTRALPVYTKVTYVNPIQLEHEGNRIFLFWRDRTWRPAFSTSVNGVTWSPRRILIDTGEVFSYVKYASDGESRIHFAFTDTHPEFSAENNIYYAYYEDGAFYRADGSLIRTIEALPLVPAEVDKIYDARSQGARAWIWDIALDDLGHPRIAYATFPSESDHRYRYARWDGTGWRDHEITRAGISIDESGDDPYYSAGITLDPENPAVVYLARQRSEVSDLERWITTDGGPTWFHQTIASVAGQKNLRPVVPRNRRAESVAVLWPRGQYRRYTDYETSIAFVGADDPVIVAFDVQPGGCPSAIRPRPHGLVPTAILGTEQLDVRDIDVATVTVDGIAAVRANIEDDLTLVSADGCACALETPDGFADLKLFFRAEDILGTLDAQPATPHHISRFSGNLYDGTSIFGSDCVRITPAGPSASLHPMVVGRGLSRAITITYRLPDESDVRLDIYDAAGRLVRRVVDGRRGRGRHTEQWSLQNHARGIYFYRLEAGGITRTGKLLALQ